MPHKPFATLCLIASLAAFAPPALSAKAQPASDATADARVDAAKEIRLIKHKGLLLLATEINGVKGFLTVDTGAMSTTLSLGAVSALKVQLQDSDEMCIGIAGIPQRVQKGAVTGHVVGCDKSEFSLAGNYPFMDLPLQNEKLEGKPLLGLLGLATLAKAGCIMDCEKGRLILDPKGKYQPEQGWHRIQMVKAHTNNDLFVWEVPTQVNGKPCLTVVDTAAHRTLLCREDFLQAAGVKIESKGSSFAAGAGNGIQALKRAVVSDLKLGEKLSLGKIPVTVGVAPTVGETTKDSDGKDRLNVGLLGIDQLIRMGAVIDCRQGVLYAPSKPLEALDTDTDYYDPNLALKSVSRLAAAGDKEAAGQLDLAGRNGGAMRLDPEQCAKFIRRAKEKGLLKPEDLKGRDTAHREVPDPAVAVKAIQALVAAGDKEAKDTLGKAMANGGKLGLTSDQASEFVARAKEKGLLKPEDFKKGGAAVPANQGTVVKAVEALARAGDKDAMAVLGKAATNGGRVGLTPDQAAEFVARAKAQGLIK